MDFQQFDTSSAAREDDDPRAIIFRRIVQELLQPFEFGKEDSCESFAAEIDLAGEE